MDKAAIDSIVTLALQAHAAGDLKTFTPAILVNGQPLSIEHLQEGRARFRGVFATSMVSEYVNYIKAHTGGEGFIDPDVCAARVFLNLGTKETPGHGDWIAALNLKPTAAFAALLAMNAQRKAQRELVEWVEDWAANLEAMNQGGTVIGIATALPELRNLKIKAVAETTHQDRDLGATRTALEDIEASSAGGIPSHLIFNTEPYAGFAKRSIKMRVSVITGEKPAIVLRIVGKEQLEEDIAREFKEILLRDIGAAATLTIGAFKP
jgi:uncharacterized protein YfdQ (DUF2303 family)